MIEGFRRGGNTMEINLTPEQRAIAQDAIENMAAVKGITQEQAATDLLATGINSWYAQEGQRKQREASKARNFNPFAAARGEYKNR